MYSSTLANAHAPNPILDMSFKHSWACPKTKSRGGFLGKWWESESKQEYTSQQLKIPYYSEDDSTVATRQSFWLIFDIFLMTYGLGSVWLDQSKSKECWRRSREFRMVLVSSLVQMWRHKTDPIKVVKKISKISQKLCRVVTVASSSL